MKNNLFICRANVDRSKTAEVFFAEQFNLLDFRSAGIDQEECDKNNTTFLTQELINWADRIFIMEESQLHWINDHLNISGKETHVLNIEDKHTYYSIALIEELQRKCNKYFE